MASLADLFNPTFFMFLGILVLVAALLVIYFESKMRDQNHKIASMLSLVSTLAEDMNGIKMGFNQLPNLVTRMSGSGSDSIEKPLENSKIVLTPHSENNLIEVSDNDYQEEDDDDFEDSDLEASEDEEDSDLEDAELVDDDDEDIKILKIDMKDMNLQNHLESEDLEMNDLDSNNDFNDNDDFNVNNDLDSNDDFNVNNDLDEQLSETESVISVLSKSNFELISEEKVPEEVNDYSQDLKKININLEDIHYDSNEYKKMSIAKLRHIVSEKGLAPDTSKLNKNKLLKLLGIE